MILQKEKIIIIGGGILGLSIARKFLKEGFKKITILEKEKDIANHQSSRNSGVMHAGLYYPPNSLKAKLSREGILLMKDYCNQNSIKWEECGKVVVATSQNELERLDSLFNNGKINQLIGIKKLTAKEVNLIEPYVESKAGIHVPEESIVSYKEVARKYKEEIIAFGGRILCSSKVVNINHHNEYKELVLQNGDKLCGDIIISTAGLYSDKISKILGIDIEKKQILPFRGEYYCLKPDYEYLVKSLIYPVPNPKLPFLGVHFTKMINGGVEAGPNAILALAREGYKWSDINLNELYESISYIGLQRFILKYPLISAGEIIRSLSKNIFLKSLQKLIPDIKSEMIYRGPSGIRAQLMNQKGDLEQDFDIRIKGNFISILNAPSPAATSSLSIADYVVRSLIS
ncbi:L-2-hydroxyglutarate oxidase [Prochlorococcus marinus]|uniref:Predicted dehydrogenase n=1 Tax=Prochlorococcus marinus (strain AS9601) TaxID=146891 RepID=A2BSE1_PROMS|nr:L-2-hydroxyglutarate oxidase [Prochlorococcus marinus]ABM70702.1 Predicted dehydrogenase [Prochlorococcus marinus str. AS9601]